MLLGIGTRAIDTPRLELRRFHREDAGDMFRNWTHDSEVTQYLSWQPHESLEYTQNVLAGWLRGYRHPYNFNWAIVPREAGMAVGSISILGIQPKTGEGEAGYCLGKAFWGQGYMTEALYAVLEYAFVKVGFERIAAKHDVRNPASGSVMKKCAMRYEKQQKETVAEKNMEILCDHYSITSSQWLQKHPERGAELQRIMRLTRQV